MGVKKVGVKKEDKKKGVKKSEGKKKMGVKKTGGKKRKGKKKGIKILLKKKWINIIRWITMTTNYYQLLEVKLLGGISYKIH